MKQLTFLLLITFCAANSYAQSAEDSVKAVINKLFTAMKNSDATSLQECFADSAILQTITASGRVRTDEAQGFVKQVGSLPKGAADERITFDVVKVDDALAIAWTPYQFYFNSKFSHCGVNSFQLVRFNGVWKIQYLIDTRRKTGCQ
jgi:hypothetical protein